MCVGFSNYTIVPGDQGVQKGNMAIDFSFNGKGNLGVDEIQSVVEGWNGVFLDDDKNVFHIWFPNFGWYRGINQSLIFNYFHADVSYNMTYWATHGTTLDLLVSTFIVDKIVVWRNKFQKGGDAISSEICSGG